MIQTSTSQREDPFCTRVVLDCRARKEDVCSSEGVFRCDECWQKFWEKDEQDLEEELGSGHDEGEASGEEGEAFSTGSESDKEV